MRAWKWVVALAVLGEVAALAGQTPTLTMALWRYGAICWVDQAPPYLAAEVNRITNFSHLVLREMDIVPYPTPVRPQGEPVVISASDRYEARAQLPPDFSGALIPGPNPKTFWALYPLTSNDRKMAPLVVVVFPSMDLLQDTLGHYGIAGAFVLPDRLATDEPRLLWEGWFYDLAQDPHCALVAVAWEDLSPHSQPLFEQALAHEFAHWALWIWCVEHDVEHRSLPLLLVEGLSTYILLTLFQRVEMSRRPPSEFHAMAAYWARERGLRQVPEAWAYFVGASLVDFLARQYGLPRLLRLLPEFIANWEENLEAWEPEWKAWLAGDVPDVSLGVALLEQDLPLCANLLTPVFPGLRELLPRIFTPHDLARFWQRVEGPPEPATPELWEAMHRRERQFLYMALETKDEKKRANLQALLDNLNELRANQDWDAYVRAFVQGVKEFIAGLPTREPVEVP